MISLRILISIPTIIVVVVNGQDIYAPQFHNYVPSKGYHYAYQVSDHYTGDHKSQWETKNNGVIHGSYSFLEADGTIRVVDYTADDKNGFRAVVNRYGLGQHLLESKYHGFVPETYQNHNYQYQIPDYQNEHPHAYDGQIRNYLSAEPAQEQAHFSIEKEPIQYYGQDPYFDNSDNYYLGNGDNYNQGFGSGYPASENYLDNINLNSYYY